MSPGERDISRREERVLIKSFIVFLNCFCFKFFMRRHLRLPGRKGNKGEAGQTLGTSSRNTFGQPYSAAR